MFTGIVEELGEVTGIDRLGDSAKLAVRGTLATTGVAQGSSIAVNGVCVTVTSLAEGEFTADVMGETLARTSLGGLAPGRPVNLERPVAAGGRLDGHIVQGHVDGTGVVIESRPADRWHVLRISTMPALMRYIAKKGSVAVDGVSLTVSELGDSVFDDDGGSWFEVSLIPETLARTTLGHSAVGAVVNIEVDVIAKYVERLMARDAR
ncbi:MAG TPA: riboflavin synthase [Streptosporangiaceae bacterium]|jgi:riboflavin synthase